jgi:hypothetical protein
MTGSAETDPAKAASMYDHDLETATPFYYAAILEKPDISPGMGLRSGAGAGAYDLESGAE